MLDFDNGKWIKVDSSTYESGNGCGNGYGYGYGDGYGSGYGNGSGSGYGYGNGEYWASVVEALYVRPIPDNTTLAFWRSNKDGTPSNGGRSLPVKEGDIQKENGPLVLCSPGTLHATLKPERWSGDRIWLVALVGKVVGDHEKYGCLERHIIKDVTEELSCLFTRTP